MPSQLKRTSVKETCQLGILHLSNSMVFPMSQNTMPHYHPISAIGLIGTLIDEGKDIYQTQLNNLKMAEETPYLLDDDIIDRVLAFQQEGIESCNYYKEQVNRWKHVNATDDKKQELKRLEGQLDDIQEILHELKLLANTLKQGTINRIIEMDDIELAIQALSGKIRIPF